MALLGHPSKFTYCLAGRRLGIGDPDDWVACFATPADVLVLVAGGGGVYSTVMPSWCAGTHRNRYVSEIVWTDQACEIPGFAGS